MENVLRAFFPLRPYTGVDLPAPLTAWRRWRRLAAERRALAALDARLLADIGLDPIDAARESERPFWDAPATR